MSLERVASQLPDPCTGADIGAVVSRAYSTALERSIRLLRKLAAEKMSGLMTKDGKMKDTLCGICVEEDGSDEEEEEDEDSEQGWAIHDLLSSMAEDDPMLAVKVTEEDLLLAAKQTKPSLTRAELERYERMGNVFDSLGQEPSK